MKKLEPQERLVEKVHARCRRMFLCCPQQARRIVTEGALKTGRHKEASMSQNRTRTLLGCHGSTFPTAGTSAAVILLEPVKDLQELRLVQSAASLR